MLVVFDVVGTILSLDRVRDRMREQDMPAELLQWWFARLQQTIFAGGVLGRYIPFREAAETSLRQVLAVANYRVSQPEPILDALNNLDPWPDADLCLHLLRSEGHALVALTNSSREAAHKLLAKAELRELFQFVLSADEVSASKPDPRPYRMALERGGYKASEACLVAAHAWDILGADAVGLRTVWVEQLEKRWPFPGSPPGRVAATLAQVPETIREIG